MISSRDCYDYVRQIMLNREVVDEDFATRSISRIDAQGDELGASYLFASLPALVRKLREEAEDVAAFSALIAARLHYDSEHSPDENIERTTALLTAVVQRAGEADTLIAEIARFVERKA